MTCTNSNIMMKFNTTKLMHEKENQKYIHKIEEVLEANHVDEKNIEQCGKRQKKLS